MAKNKTDVALLKTDLDMLEQRVHTDRERCAQQMNVIWNLKEDLKQAEAELARRQAMLERDVRICDAVAELLLDD